MKHQLMKSLPLALRRGTVVVASCLLTLTLGVAGDRVAVGQDSSNLYDLIGDVQMIKEQDGWMTMVLWFPKDFFVKTSEQDASLSNVQMQKITSFFEPHIMVAIISRVSDRSGKSTFRDEETLREIVTITDAAGRQYRPLPDKAVNSELNSLISGIMKPLLSSQIGSMGANMHFLFFEAQDADGNEIAEATKSGQFTVDVGKQQFQYKLPLGSLLPEKKDPITGESFPGNYFYNPFTGRKLSLLKK